MSLLGLLGLLAGLALTLAPAFSLWTFLRVRRLERELEDLRRQLGSGGETARPAHGGEGERAPAPPSVPAGVQAAGGPLAQLFLERWLVLAGGAALALAGVLAAAYALEQGWFGPRLWLSGLALLALAAAAAGFALDRRRGPGLPGWLPAALVGGGLVTLWATVFAARRIFDLLGPLPTAAMAWATAIVALTSGLRFGWLLSLLGTLAAFAVPLFFDRGPPELDAGYTLYLVTTAAIVVLVALRRRFWWLVLLAAFAETGLLLLLAGAAAFTDARLEPERLALFGAGLALAAMLPPPIIARRDPAAVAAPAMRAALTGLHGVGGIAALVAFTIRPEAPAAIPGLGLACAAGACAPFAALRFRAPALLSAGLAVLATALREADILRAIEPHLYEPEVGLLPLFAIPPGLVGPVRTAAVVAAAWGVGGLLLARLAEPRGLWAGLAVATPLLVLVVLWLRLAGFGVEPRLAAASLALAVLWSLLAGREARRGSAAEPVLAALVAGASAALLLAAAMALDRIWLHPAWAGVLLLLVVLPHSARLPVAGWIPLALAGALALRLVWQAFAPGAAIGPLASLAVVWLLPAVLVWVAHRLAGCGALAVALAGVRDLALLLFAAEAVAVTNGIALALADHALLRAGVALGIWLLVLRTLLALRPLLPAGRTLDLAPLLPAAFAVREAWRLFAGEAEPARSALDIGLLPVWDALLAGYLLPALLLAALARSLGRGRARIAAGGAGLAFLLAWLHHETRHLFHGAILSAPPGDAERLVLLLVWLGFALLCLFVGRIRDSAAARQAAVATVVVATLRVLLFDLPVLPGLYRAGELAALGLVLLLVAAFARGSRHDGRG